MDAKRVSKLQMPIDDKGLGLFASIAKDRGREPVHC